MKKAKRIFYKLIIVLLGCICLSVIYNCGGSGDKSSVPIVPTEKYVYGTAASGAPIVGTVNVRGADGKISYSSIDSTGFFRVDVSALTAPFVVWAEGMANGTWVQLFSTIDKPGRVNVTPITDMVVAKALKKDPKTYYEQYPTASAPNSKDLDDAEKEVRTMLDSIFDMLNMPEDFNLMNGEFIADGKGIDQVLDALDISTDEINNTITCTDKTSGTVLYEEDLDTGVVNTLPPGDVANLVQGSISVIDELNEIMDLWNQYFSIATPPQALLDEIDEKVSNNFLDYGHIKGEDTGKPPIGFKFDRVTVYRPMTQQIFEGYTINEHGANVEGYWCIINYSYNNKPIDSFLTSFVRETPGEPLIWYGNRNPFANGALVRAHMIRELYGFDRGEDYLSGFDVWINDIGNRAYNKGIDTVYVVGDGIMATIAPASTKCLKMRKKGISTEYEIINADTPLADNWYFESAGLKIDEIDNMEYVLYGSTDSVSGLIAVWISILPGKPLKQSELTAAHFTKVTTPLDHAISSIADKIPGLFDITWQNPDDMYTAWIDLWWGDFKNDWTKAAKDNPIRSDYSFDKYNWTSHEFDTTSSIIDAEYWAGLAVVSKDVFGREFRVEWRWELMAQLQLINDGRIVINEGSIGDWAGIEPIFKDEIDEFPDDSIDLDKFYMVKDSTYLYWRMDVQGNTLNTDYNYGIFFDNTDWSLIGRISSSIAYDYDNSVWIPNLGKQISDTDWESPNVSTSLGIQGGTIAMKIPLTVFNRSAYMVSGGTSQQEWTRNVYVKLY